jgi:hypothetical protein
VGIDAAILCAVRLIDQDAPGHLTSRAVANRSRLTRGPIGALE